MFRFAFLILVALVALSVYAAPADAHGGFSRFRQNQQLRRQNDLLRQQLLLQQRFNHHGGVPFRSGFYYIR